MQPHFLPFEGLDLLVWVNVLVLVTYLLNTEPLPILYVFRTVLAWLPLKQ